MTKSGAHSARATAALQRLVEVDPAFGSLSLWCLHRDATPEMLGVFARTTVDGDAEVAPIMGEIAPAYTDGRTVFYGSEFAEWPLAEQVGVCAHEILHIAFRHVQRGKALAERFGQRHSHRIFNVATDALINETLVEAGFSLPDGGVRLGKLPSPFSEMSSGEFLAKWDAETLYLALLEMAEQGGAKGKAVKTLAGDLLSDMDISGALSETERAEGAEWEQRIARAFAAGRAAGRGIGTIAHRLRDLPKSRTPWERILRRLLGKAVAQVPVQTYERPTRRWLALDDDARRSGTHPPAFQPGVRSTIDRPRVAVCVDVSGSISPSLVDRFAAEIVRIGKRTGAALHLIVFDHGIQLSCELDSIALEQELKETEFKSGGGTSFIEPVETALENDPSAIVVLTDLYGPFGPAPKGIPVIWACPDESAPRPPFGRVVTMVG